VIAAAWLSIIACLVVMILVVLLVRSAPVTLALPLSYIINLLLIHLPGAYAFAISDGQYSGISKDVSAISTGIILTAIAALCFLIGCLFSIANARNIASVNIAIYTKISNKFIVFCLISGWILSFGVGILRAIPTVGAAIYFGSSIWMLVAATSLATAVTDRNAVKILTWLALLFAYPFIVLTVSGFMSYGTTAVIIVGSLAVIRMRSALQSILIIIALSYVGLSGFVNYFESRTELRSTLWSGAGFEERVGAVVSAFSALEPFSSGNTNHMRALTIRLNQNEFVGLAAERLRNGQAEYLHGESFYEAIISPIPRVFWKDKPVGGGSGRIVRNMTGLRLDTHTSWGVGNVMEFYINFGLWSLIPCFLLLGWLLGWLDRRAAMALATSDPSRALLYFLPGVALIQPNGSLVEVVGGAFAALLAAAGLRLVWTTFQPRSAPSLEPMSRQGGFVTR